MKQVAAYKEKVNQVLREFLDSKIQKEGAYSQETKQLIKHIKEYNLRDAKRIRPIATIFAYKCFKEDDKILGPSIAIELMQAYLLMHDDIMDRDDLRRGKPAFHKLYRGEEFGVSMAIMAGNLCASYMNECVLESDFGEKEKNEAIKYLSWINNRENYGQALDMLPGFEKFGEEQVLKVYELKTATYTIQGPLYLGCALAQAPKEITEKLQTFGYNVGIAFQITDDLNGMFGDIEKIGKPTDSDIKEGKKTLLIVKTLELTNQEDREFILNHYGKEEASDDDIKKIKTIVTRCGALDYCKKFVANNIETAKQSIEPLALREEGREFLMEIADYIESLIPKQD